MDAVAAQLPTTNPMIADMLLESFSVFHSRVSRTLPTERTEIEITELLGL